MKTKEIQRELGTLGLDAWLLYDFRGINPIAQNIAGLSGKNITRRWFCLIPARGEPQWLVHKIETSNFVGVQGNVALYAGWQELNEAMRVLLATPQPPLSGGQDGDSVSGGQNGDPVSGGQDGDSGIKTVAMEYSPNAEIPYISRVDAGTLEWIRSFGVEIRTSADLAQRMEARLNEAQAAGHQESARLVLQAKDYAFAWIGSQLKDGKTITEYDVQQEILGQFDAMDLVTDHPPIVAVNAKSSDPHYAPTATDTQAIKGGDFILIDLWAKQKESDAVFADTTWVAYAGKTVPSQYVEIFEIVKEARDRAVEFIRERWGRDEPIHGYQVDDCVRGYITEKGYGEFFIHRTGHNIGTVIHGNGVNLDNLETRDRRTLIPGVCFSIEPGIYLNDFGVRTEIDVFLAGRGRDGVKVTTAPVQNQVLPLL